MISPLVLSRQPCITPGAGHSFGNGLGGNGGGGGGVELGPGRSSGSVVNGCDWALSNRAQPDTASNAAHDNATTPRNGPRRSHARQVTDCCGGARHAGAFARALLTREHGAQKRRANPRFTDHQHLP